MGSRSLPAAECGALAGELSQRGETFVEDWRESKDDIKGIRDKEEILRCN